jgi:RES domain-containing protein
VTLTVWRISNHADLSGEGGRRSAGRWNRRGTPIVYCADHPASAILEILVNLDREDLPSGYKLLEIALEASMFETIKPLPSNWLTNPDATRDAFEAFRKSALKPVLKVPSSVAPNAWNYLINPDHPDAIRISIKSVTDHAFDERLKP